MVEKAKKHRARAPVVDVFVCVRLYKFAQVQQNSNACCFDTNFCAGFTWTVLEFGQSSGANGETYRIQNFDGKNMTTMSEKERKAEKKFKK